ncbi:hypothetical protein RJ640_023641 [Escallonia rubra]|uniref:Glutaredoxin domain-containing protein n=1 Tax=Escallonia rubra TaxID=112253 RepID=A0AA88SDF5_9ASTE|nr:hypothetical protein RJ640_023641 [Escallonia rubra]
MGCTASRPDILFTSPTEEQTPPSNPSSSNSSSSTPISRTLSLPTPLVHHPPIRKGDTNHLVSLTSTTYGSLILVDPIPNPNPNPDPKDPSSPDSVINTWELMEGLDDFDFDIVHYPKPNSSIYEKPISGRVADCNGSAKKGCDEFDFDVVHYPEPNSSICEKPSTGRVLDFNGSGKNSRDDFEALSSYELVEYNDSKPLWKHLSEESLLAKMDPNVVSSYRRALSARMLGCKDSKDSTPKAIRAMEFDNVSCLLPSAPTSEFYLLGNDDRIVLYYTSLRGIRKTYEDCCTVRMILKAFRVYVDERDISMDSAYRKELQGVFGGKEFSLPQVFIRGKYVGGADEIKQLHEAGELVKLLEGFPAKDPGFVCHNCGDARFVPCANCNGSRKVFEEEEGKLKRCPDCNENGLIRCPSCCS